MIGRNPRGKRHKKERKNAKVPTRNSARFRLNTHCVKMRDGAG